MEDQPLLLMYVHSFILGNPGVTESHLARAVLPQLSWSKEPERG